MAVCIPTYYLDVPTCSVGFSLSKQTECLVLFYRLIHPFAWQHGFAYLAGMQVLVPRPALPLRLPSAWTDSDLLAALPTGNGEAFAEIYKRYGLLLLEQASRKTGSREAAEEIVQDIFTALWQRREHAASIKKLPEYLSTAVKFRVINLIKNRYAHDDYAAYRRSLATEADHHTENDLAATDLAGALHAGLTHLPSHTREIFQLSRFEHQTVPEIAGRLKLTPKAVEYHITRALKLLRVSLKDFLVLLFIFSGLAN